MECNHGPEKVLIGNQLIICNRGESLQSQDTWARRWGWHKSRVRRFFKLLENDAMIDLIPNRETTHLRVCNYDIYQQTRITDESQMNRKRITDESRATPNNNDNNDNNENKERGPKRSKRFVKPSADDVSAYASSIGYDELEKHPQKFLDFYEAKGWTVGKNPMKDWRAAVRTWKQRRDEERPAENKPLEAYEYMKKSDTKFEWVVHKFKLSPAEQKELTRYINGER